MSDRVRAALFHWFQALVAWVYGPSAAYGHLAIASITKAADEYAREYGYTP